MTHAQQTLKRALGYPYPRPPVSFIFPCDTCPPALSPVQEASILSDRSLNFVLVVGSNAAPARLLDKFGPSSYPIPVLSVNVSDVDVVHSASLTKYGSIPATITPCPGAVLSTHATMLTDAQLSMMNDTEYGYYLVQVRTELVRMNSGLPIPNNTPVLAYVSAEGPLKASDGHPKALTLIKAQGRLFTEWEQRHALEFVMATAVAKGITARDEGLEAFILRNTEDDSRRKNIIGAIKEVASTTVSSDGFWQVLRLLP